MQLQTHRFVALPHHHRPALAHQAPRLVQRKFNGHKRPSAALRGEVLSAPDTTPILQLATFEDDALWEPSHDLRELAAAQLRSLFAVLARVSPAHSSSCRAFVYARRADSLDSPQIRLQRAACWPSKIHHPVLWAATAGQDATQRAGGSCYNSFEELDDLLVLHRPAWEPSSSSSSSGGSSSSSSSAGGAAWDTEASLCQEEVVLLPSSNMLVLPLTEAGVLVGLLVVEVSGSSSSSTDQQQQQQQQHEWGAAGLSEDALWCLRMAVPPLAKACAMDMRQALSGAQQEAQQRLARSLLSEARGPLKVLGTFGQMLAPRLQAAGGAEPESDMAAGMLLQGQRLADVVQQLEAALRPTAAAVRSSSWQQQQQQQLALPPAAGAGVVPYDSIDEDSELWGASSSSSSSGVWAPAPASLLQQQEQAARLQRSSCLPAARGPGPAADAAGAARPSGLLPESSSSSSTVASGAWTDAQGVVHLPGQGTASSLGASSRDIRWGSVQPAVATPQPVSVRSSRSTSSTSTRRASACYSPITDELDMNKTIELVEEDAVPGSSRDAASWDESAVDGVMPPAWMAQRNSSSSSSSSSSSGSWESSSRSYKAAGGFVRPASHRSAVCNLIDVFSNLLAAATKLAAVNGINLIVNDPLQLDTGISSSSSSSARPPVQPDRSADASGSSSDGSGMSSARSSAHALLPRPVRPLLVGMAAATCKRVMGYVLDVALQCTPRGGQLCVTTRQSAGGVEVLLQHTGKVSPDRLHPTTPGLSQAAAAAAATAASPVQQQAQPPAAVQPLQQQQQQQQLMPKTHKGGLGVALSGEQRSGGGRARRGRRSGSMQELAAGSGGSRLVSLEFATQILATVGGRLSVVYPMHFMNAISGQLEVGSSIEVWLPPPAAT